MRSREARRKQIQTSYATKAYGKKRSAALTDFQELRRLQEADSNGLCKCVTCPTIRPWNYKMQGGHFITRAKNSTAFEPMNVWPQCVDCNNQKSGNESEYRKFLLGRFGEGEVDALILKGNQTVTLDFDEVIEWRLDWLEEIAELKRQKAQ